MNNTTAYLYNHIFLPRKVPPSSDSNFKAGDQALTLHLIECVRVFCDQLPPEEKHQWRNLSSTLDVFARLHEPESGLSRTAIQEILGKLEPGDTVILHVALQNSALILRRSADHFYIESFEAAAPAAAVLSASDTLQWDFPSQAITIPVATFIDAQFLASLSEFLEQASIEPVREYAAKSLKAGSSVYESRDTPSPAVVGQLLLAILEANGCKASVECSRKRIHDDVCWSDGAENPWRRSPTWLVLRVGLQRCLSFMFGGDCGTFYYKIFMCFVHARLYEKCGIERSVTSDQLAFARKRVGRRAAKLQHRKRALGKQLDPGALSLLDRWAPIFLKILEKVNNVVEEHWAQLRRRITKKIPPIPRRADAQSTTLKLSNGLIHLFEIINATSFRRPIQQPYLEKCYKKIITHSSWSAQQFENVKTFNDYLRLFHNERNFRAKAMAERHSLTEDQCLGLLAQMQKYYTVAREAYRADPRHSSQMLLLLMEIWRVIDASAVAQYPQLAKYRPGFPDDLLHVLQLADISDMKRLHLIELYLRRRNRQADASLTSIFGDIKGDSFQVQYFDQSESLQQCLCKISDQNEKKKAQKEIEWRRMSKEYEDKTQKAMQLPCQYTEDTDNPLLRIHDDRCHKCFLNRSARRMSIKIHESRLPSDDTQAKALVFELNIPKGFAAWRDATWFIMRLGDDFTSHDSGNQISLCKIPRIRRFQQPCQFPFRVELVSSTKSFYSTHYRVSRFPVNFKDICYPHGSRYALSDRRHNIWTSRQNKNACSFAQICSPFIPSNSAYSAVKKYVHPTLQGEAITSNMIIASQTTCPNSLSMSDFLAFQDLRIGNGVQWIRLVRELASSNLNFGAAEVYQLVAELALMAGPPLSENTLRSNHWVLEDERFCSILVIQIRKRLENIVVNWREGQTLECLLMLVERLWFLSPTVESHAEAEKLLIFIRQTALDWVHLLRYEVCNASDVSTAQKRSKDAFVAAILCRKTFLIEATMPESILTEEHLACFLECALTVKENRATGQAGEITKLPVLLRNLYISDLKLVYSLEHQLRRSIELNQSAVNQVMNFVWGGEENVTSLALSPWEFLATPHDNWITAKSIANREMASQVVYFDILEGTLLIDGQPVSRLPDEYTRQSFYQEIFNDRVFFTYPSGIPGMSYMLATPYEGHQVHFGLRNGSPVMRVRSLEKAPTLFELIPREMFSPPGSRGVPDLPVPLLEKHIHWLDIAGKRLIVRPISSMWRGRASDWTVDLICQQGVRRKSLLVDPNSSIFTNISQVIEPFESRRRMVMHQPQFNNLSLKLPSLELSFRVNDQGLLESEQLGAVVDSDQDIGTLYGMKSSLVLRDKFVAQDRTILVSMGTATIEQQWGHPSIVIHHNGYYARFAVNTLLGRLECACEPRLIYFKAYCHAITASAMPDPLTGRTGTEEALHCLKAGNAQPWAPLDPESHILLHTIAAMTPARLYYPEEMKVLQRVVWADTLASEAQDEGFRPIVEHILSKCDKLDGFYQSRDKPPILPGRSDSHLRERALTRSRKFQAVDNLYPPCAASDLQYFARDCLESSSYQRAFKTATLVKRWSDQITERYDLCLTFNGLPLIQGSWVDFNRHLLSDRLSMNLTAYWGSLFETCRDAIRSQDEYRLMFLFATVAFGEQKNDAMIHTLIAIAASSKFDQIEMPSCPSFRNFCSGARPAEVMLTALAKECCEPYPPELQYNTSNSMNNKESHKLEVAQVKHQETADASCRRFAQHLLPQWPMREPSIIGLKETPLLDVEKAFESIRTEWERLHDNFQLEEHLKLVQRTLIRYHNTEPLPIPQSCSTLRHLSSLVVNPFSYPSLPELMTHRPIHRHLESLPLVVEECLDLALKGLSSILLPTSPSIEGQNQTLTTRPSTNQRSNTASSALTRSDLRKIVNALLANGDIVSKEYGEDLMTSLDALEKLPDSQAHLLKEEEISFISAATNGISARFKIALTAYYDWLHRSLVKDFPELRLASLLPRITPIAILETLRLPNMLKISSEQTAVVEYGELIRNLQRLRRISSAARRFNSVQLADELLETSKSSSGSSSNLDWFLLEIDFDLRIRKEQYEVAGAMIAPQDGANSLLQLNMGQGKSSVITPMIVACLADAKSLARVVVPKPLLMQTAQLLQGRLGGLLGREIIHIPFSRRSSTRVEDVQSYLKMHREILRSRGVILTLPEHMLSFQLSGLQELCNEHYEQAGYMIKAQNWLKLKSRDILDESDHMLAVKTQLIYPSGAQDVVDGHPFRWTVVQAMLRLTRSLLPGLQTAFPRNIEVIERASGTFPTVYLLDQDVREALLQRLIDSILKGDGGILPIGSCSAEELETVKMFLCDARLRKDMVTKVNTIFKIKPDAHRQLLLLRGLIIHRILLLGLSKRWNVQYGIHPGRDPIAVPFRSKGIPSEHAEFGHPDVSILLTCLSFYQSGLTFPQFLQALNNLLRSDEPVREFDLWRQDVERFPDSLCSWNSINVDDETQTRQLWDLLRLQMPVINYFMNQFVFPRHARTFKVKLTSSGWDMPAPYMIRDISCTSNKVNCAALAKPLKDPAQVAKPMTVGFSGTNDNKGLLPLNIKQNDLPTLCHTNAEVLTHLLQPRNRKYVRASDRNGKRLDEKAFMRLLETDKIRILLDAGAQILELDNISLAKEWLLVATEAEAAVYFGEDGRARVVYRDGKGQPLATSPYVDNLGACVVYLDEAHTRGVDLKIPLNSKAALTLGITQTKDQTVQGTCRAQPLCS